MKPAPLNALHAFANRWLLPRIGRFQKLQPNVVVHIQASSALKSLERAEADIVNLKRYRILNDECPLEWNVWAQRAGIDTAEFNHETTS